MSQKLTQKKMVGLYFEKKIFCLIKIITVAHINCQVQSCVNLIKVALNCLKYTQESELMILKIQNYWGIIDNVHNSLILSSRRKCYKEDPPKTTNLGCLSNIFTYLRKGCKKKNLYFHKNGYYSVNFYLTYMLHLLLEEEFHQVF